MKYVNRRLALASLFVCIMLAAASVGFAQITPLQDSYTSSTTPTVNYGTATSLGVVNSTSSIQSTYIQFDLSSIPSGYTGSNVAKATLKLYVNSVAKAGSFNVVMVNGSWSEKTITSGIVPALGSTIAASVPLTTAKLNDYILIDVTTAVDAWLNGTQPNDGLALIANSPLSASFDSKENYLQGHSAELDVVFTSAGGGITGITTASGSGLAGGGNSGTLSLSLLKTCSANQVLQWKSNAWVCSAAGTGTISGVTAGTGLTGGGTGGVVTLSLDTTKVPELNTANHFTGNQSITGNLSTTGSFSASNAAVINATPGATAIYGFASASTGAGWGVAGSTNSTNSNAFGVYGAAVATSGSATGVYGSGSIGVKGLGTVTGNGAGGSFTGFSAQPNSGQRSTVGVLAYGGSGDTNTTYGAEGVLATGGNGIAGGNGVEAYGGSGNGQTYSSGAGVYGWGGNGSSGGAPGVYGMGGWSPISNGSGGWFVGAGIPGGQGGGDGVDAYAGGGYAGNFYGDVNITGNLSAATKNFKIDHPLDPANKFLVHASVESSELMNIYSGNVITDVQGDATVTLPDWFEAENTDFRYQLTVVGQFAQAIVANEIANHQFQIKTSAPNVKVSWQVTGVRQDAYAQAHPLVVEEQKDEHLRGYFIHPELHGAPSEKQIEWARHAATMQNMKAKQAKLAAQ
jgi:hypothetical protein